MKVSNKALTREITKREIEAKLAPKFIIEDYLFKEQLDFVKDPARFATAVCSVRAGKTVSCAADLIDTAQSNPGTIGLYITLSRTNAKKIIWADLRKIIRKFKIKAEFNETELSVKFSNGSVIYCFGASDETAIENIRGLSNVILAYVDECQAFRSHLKELVEDILIKRLYDTNGRCRLIGTPGPIPSGYFYDMAHSSKWSHYAWTLHKNPWIEKKSGLTVDALIQQDCDMRGVTVDHPSIQRECFGRWVLDKNSLILQYTAEKNDYDALPPGQYNFILGVDLGWHDSDSLSCLAWSDNSPITYLVEEVVTPNQKIDPLVEAINKINAKTPVSKMLMDTGGLGKKIAESIRTRFGFPLEAADKTRKMENYRILNNAMSRGHFKAKKTSRFAQDCSLLEKDQSKSTPDKIVVKGHSDAIDSVLYPFKESPAYTYTAPIPKTVVGSPEYYNEEVDRMHKAQYEAVKKEQDQQNDPYGMGWGFDPLANLDKWKK
jgi:Phage terminase large subunit